MTPRPVSAAAARRFLVLRHFLTPPRSLPPGKASILAVFDRLGSIQFDPLEVAGRNHDLVLHARVGGYRREWTDALLYEDRRLFEAHNKGLSLLPVDELPWYRIAWDRQARAHAPLTFSSHSDIVDLVVERIRTEGPLSSLDFDRGERIDWYWGPANSVKAVLEALAEAGVLGLARREGNRRYYDLSARLHPEDRLGRRAPERAQLRHKLLSRYRAHGLLGSSGSAELWSGLGSHPSLEDSSRLAPSRRELLGDLVDAGDLIPIAVEGVRSDRFVLRAELALLARAEAETATESTGTGGCTGAAPSDAQGTSATHDRPGNGPGVAFLAPLDPLAWDRDLLRSLFDFDYVWEVYVPAAKRRWGYYVLPLLFGDRIVGRIEPRIDRRASVVRVLGLRWEPGFDPLVTPGFVDAFAAALDAYRGFAGARRALLPRDRSSRELVAAVREAAPGALGR